MRKTSIKWIEKYAKVCYNEDSKICPTMDKYYIIYYCKNGGNMNKVAEIVKKSSESTAIEMEEYRALRTEIITYINAKQNLIYLSVLVILALLGLQITTKQYLFSLCSIVTIVVFYIQDLNYKIGIAECGAYIRAKFEDGSNGLNWETTLSKINMRYDQQKNTPKITVSKKYKKHFKSIFDSRIVNHFSVFTLISLIVGWSPFLEELKKSKVNPKDFIKNEMVNVIIMGLATVIGLSFIIYIICIRNRDFNRIRKEFYIKIKKIIHKKRHLKT